MSYSFSYTDTLSFTRTHARHMVAKVATDLKRMQRLLWPSGRTARSRTTRAEAIEFLKEGYLGTVMYGFRRNGNWIEPTLFYTSRDLAGASANDDDPGRVRPGARMSAGASFYSYHHLQSRLGSILNAARARSLQSGVFHSAATERRSRGLTAT